jgi:hypothetical protein
MDNFIDQFVEKVIKWENMIFILGGVTYCWFLALY